MEITLPNYYSLAPLDALGDESLGWSATGPQKGVAVSATFESPSESRLEDGSPGKGCIPRGWNQNYVAITPPGSAGRGPGR